MQVGAVIWDVYSIADMKMWEEFMESSRLDRKRYLLLTVVGILLILAAAVEYVQNTQGLSRGTWKNQEPYKVQENVTCEEIEDAALPAGVWWEYRFRLDPGENRECGLAFYTVHQYVKVYLDGEEIYQLMPSEKRVPFSVKTVGSNWNMIMLDKADAGKEIQVEIIPVYRAFRSRQVEFFVGSLFAVFLNRFYLDLPQLVLGMMTVFMGIVLVFMAVYSEKRKRKIKGLFHLGVFSSMIGIWKLSDTRFTPFLFPKIPVFVSMLTMLMLLLGPIPLLQWIKEKECTSRKTCRALDICSLFTVLHAGAQIILQFLGVRDLRQMLPLTHTVLIADLIFAAVCAAGEQKKRGTQKKDGEETFFFCVLAVGIMVDVAVFYKNGHSSGLLFSMAAYFLYIVYMGISTMFHYSEQEIQIAKLDQKLAEQERELTEERITLMFGQIREHFIFNILATISGYCKVDPQKADEIVVRFSRYLRKNMKLIEEEGLIPFSKEMEQLEDFVALEQVRFPDRIHFEKDMRVTEFLIPPFTLQPLVENAVRHGILKTGGSGTIRLETKREDHCIVITVGDDGAGYQEPETEKKNSVEIRNVRYRLEHMADGRLEIGRGKEKGTKAEIRLPEKD